MAEIVHRPSSIVHRLFYYHHVPERRQQPVDRAGYRALYLRPGARRGVGNEETHGFYVFYAFHALHQGCNFGLEETTLPGPAITLRAAVYGVDEMIKLAFYLLLQFL